MADTAVPADSSTDDPETRARAFAVAGHGDQRYGDRPYVVHLEAVRAVLRDFDHAGDLAVAAWLHDVVEDTPTSQEDVRRQFGDEVAALVWAVTGTGATRKERNAAAYAKIRSHPRAAVLKLADRIANVEASRGTDKLTKYRNEWAGFREALAGLGDPRMWRRLEAAIASE